MTSTDSLKELPVNERIFRGQLAMPDPLPAKVKESLKNGIKCIAKYNNGSLEEAEFEINSFPIEHLLAYFELLDTALVKSSTIMELLRKQGLDFCKQKKYRLALRCFDLALNYAPNFSPMRGRIHGERAKVLAKLSEWQAAISDMDYALAMVPFEELSALMGIKSKYRAGLIQSIPPNAAKENAERAIRNNYCEKKLFHIFGESNPLIAGAGSYVRIKFNEANERCLVVEQELNAGTTVIVEDPYVTHMAGNIMWETTRYCGKCYKDTPGIAHQCTGCTFVSYCGEKCRKDDFNNGHEYECKCLTAFHGLWTDPILHISFKAICKAGPAGLMKLFTQQQVQKTEDFPIGVNPDTGVYESDNIYQIMNLGTNVSKKDQELVNELSGFAHSMVKMLETRTDFFKDVDEEQKPGFLNFVVATILKSALVSISNARGIRNCDVHDSDIVKHINRVRSSQPKRSKFSEKDILGLYSLISLLGHSCDPTVFLLSLRNGKVAAVTNRRIHKGEELTICYGKDFTQQHYLLRRRDLVLSHGIKCDCIACTGKWSTKTELLARKKPSLEYICLECRSKPYATLGSCVLVPKYGKHYCEQCLQGFDSYHLEKNNQIPCKFLEMVDSVLKNDQPVKAIPDLVYCVQYFQKNIASPSIPLIRSKETLLRAYEMIVQSQP